MSGPSKGTPPGSSGPAGALAVHRGTVLESVGGVYRVALDEGGEVDASLRGRVKQEPRTGDRVVPGDRVGIDEAHDGGHTIEVVLPRENELVRGGPAGRKAKVVVANLDRIAVVLAVDEPPFRETVADRFLVLAEVCGISPVLVLNKVDLPGHDEVVASVRDLYQPLGYPVLATSAETSRGLEALRETFARGISAMVGPSGVGKSSLLNELLPGIELRTAPVTRRGGRGRHTTVGARLIRFSADGWMADTPGFSEIGLWNVEPSALARAFPEFEDPSEECRFRVCTHSHEPECGVLAALERGEIDPRRYENYRVLLEEVSG
ncbi:MAG: ribosome small subunit-dependent GTPase A [Gemmatimonadota bacterium]